MIVYVICSRCRGRGVLPTTVTMHPVLCQPCPDCQGYGSIPSNLR